MSRDEYWVVKLQMLPDDRIIKQVAWIYRVEKDDVAFILIGDEDIYRKSQFAFFEPIRQINMED